MIIKLIFLAGISLFFLVIISAQTGIGNCKVNNYRLKFKLQNETKQKELVKMIFGF